MTAVGTGGRTVGVDGRTIGALTADALETGRGVGAAALLGTVVGGSPGGVSGPVVGVGLGGPPAFAGDFLSDRLVGVGLGGPLAFAGDFLSDRLVGVGLGGPLAVAGAFFSDRLDSGLRDELSGFRGTVRAESAGFPGALGSTGGALGRGRVDWSTGAAMVAPGATEGSGARSDGSSSPRSRGGAGSGVGSAAFVGSAGILASWVPFADGADPRVALGERSPWSGVVDAFTMPPWPDGWRGPRVLIRPR